MNNRYKCGLCDFPHNTNFGRHVAPVGISLDSLKNHYMYEHSKEYKGLLEDIKQSSANEVQNGN